MALGPDVSTSPAPTNGAAMAAILAAGIGSFALAFFVLANEAGLFTLPTLYRPAGGLSGRSTFAVVAWLVAWSLLHSRWQGATIRPARVFACAVALIVFSVVALFPPVWELL